MQSILILILTFFMTTMAFAQKNESRSENHSIKINYSATYQKKELSKICEIIVSEYADFECFSGKKWIRENKNEFILISINERKIRLVLRTTDPKNPNIEKIHKLEKNLNEL